MDSLTAQKVLPTQSPRREVIEEGELGGEPSEQGLLSMDFPSPSRGLALMEVQIQPCVVEGGTTVLSVQPDSSEQGFLRPSTMESCVEPSLSCGLALVKG